ncbi:MAG: hypothetical protein ACRDNP_03280 [Gaiellaceae bacterium]
MSADRRVRPSEADSGFPPTARALPDRLGSLHGLDSELAGARRVLEQLAR